MFKKFKSIFSFKNKYINFNIFFLKKFKILQNFIGFQKFCLYFRKILKVNRNPLKIIDFFKNLKFLNKTLL